MIASRTFRSIAEVVVPEIRSLGDAEWRECTAVVEAALAKRPAAMRRQLGMFMRILNVMSFAHTGRSISRLDHEARAAFLAKVENSPVLLLRRGFWGVRTLVFMGYYARAACATSLGYAATARGWELRR
jgi:hypothetical protein